MMDRNGHIYGHGGFLAHRRAQMQTIKPVKDERSGTEMKRAQMILKAGGI